MSLTLSSLLASEILDSRGNPTLQIVAITDHGHRVRAQVPSGASTGSGEAVELRDHDPARYDGKGVLAAAANVNTTIANTVVGRSFADPREVDETLLALDGTPNKAGLGGNAIVGVSIAAASAFAQVSGKPLWSQINVEGAQPRLPVPHFNVLNGGLHAPNDLDFQEFMVAPLGAPSYADALRAGAEVYARVRTRLAQRGALRGLGDEGGFAPALNHPDQALEVLTAAIQDAGYDPGRRGVAIALDAAASAFRKEGIYHVASESWSSIDMIGYYAELIDRFPIWSIEDGLGEDDTTGWKQLTTRLGDRIQLVGDDNFVTDPRRIEQAVTDGIANAALIKVNQIGTVTQTLEALATCRRAGYAAMVSHRSGETTDTFIADLAVGSGCGQIKSGAPAHGERLAKYLRLLDISLGEHPLPYGLE